MINATLNAISCYTRRLQSLAPFHHRNKIYARVHNSHACAVGYTLPQIKELLDSLPNERTPTAEDWEQLSEKFRESLDGKIEKLQKLRDRLSDCIGCGCLSLKSCGLYNPQDIMAQDGPGPPRLDL